MLPLSKEIICSFTRVYQSLSFLSSFFTVLCLDLRRLVQWLQAGQAVRLVSPNQPSCVSQVLVSASGHSTNPHCLMKNLPLSSSQTHLPSKCLLTLQQDHLLLRLGHVLIVLLFGFIKYRKRPVSERMMKVANTGKVQVGDLAPDFTLPAQSGALVSLGEFLGKTAIVLYFYPRDNTAICTAEACAFRDSYELFKGAGAEVIGISSDSVESHRQFAAVHQLPFILMSDVDSIVRKLYGVPTAFGLPGRVIYVIDQEHGIVRRIFFSQFTSEKHVTEALSTLHRYARNIYSRH
jgi:peroxiredoxin Q/BCP